MDQIDNTLVLEVSKGKYSDETTLQLFNFHRRFIKLVCDQLNISRKKFKKLYKSKDDKDAAFKMQIDEQYEELRDSYIEK